MERQNGTKPETMEINWEQQKVIANPVRSTIVALLYEKPMTPKQTADLLGKNPGTIYYHIQQLLKHDIIEVESINTEKGIVEKYYKAKTNSFINPDQQTPPGYVDGKTTHINLSKKLLNQLGEELEQLFFKYGHLSFTERNSEEQAPYTVKYLITEFKEEEEE